MVINERFTKRELISYADLLCTIELEFDRFLLSDTLRCIVRRLPWCKTIEGKPTEDARVHSDDATIAAYFGYLAVALEGALAGVVYSTDEVGFDELVDARKVYVIVPAFYPEQTISAPVSRRDDRASMLTSIAADARSLKPVLVMPQKRAEMELFEAVSTPEDCALLYQENGFRTAVLFERWCFEVFLPDTVERRRILGYESIILLILYGFTGHKTDAIEDAFLHNGIHPIVFPVHGSHRTQPLDLGIFRIQKSEIQTVRPDLDCSAQTRRTIKLFSGWQKAAKSYDIITVFR
jgi:hypothetical protein